MSAINVNSITGRTGTHGPVLTGVTTATNGLHVTGGNVGIGTDNPQNSLHINGTTPAIRFTDTGANGSAFSIIEDNNGLLKVRNDAGNSGTDSGITFEVDGSEKLRIDSSGNLGIGTTSPGKRLQIGDTTVNSDNVIALGFRVSSAQTNLPLIGHTSDGTHPQS